MGLNTLDLMVIVAIWPRDALWPAFRSGSKRERIFPRRQRGFRWAISLSIVAAETSTLTVISVPAGVRQDFSFLQLVRAT